MEGALQIGQFDGQHFLVPSGVERELVVGEYAGDGLVSFLTCCGDSAVAHKNVVVVINHSRRNKSELPEGGAELRDLFF